MAGFDDITRLALDPAQLMTLDPSFARQLVQRDLMRQQQANASQRAPIEQANRQAFDQSNMPVNQQGFGYLSPTYNAPRYKPAGNPNQYMLDAIERDNALASYDRQAPFRRQQLIHDWQERQNSSIIPDWFAQQKQQLLSDYKYRMQRYGDRQ